MAVVIFLCFIWFNYFSILNLKWFHISFFVSICQILQKRKYSMLYRTYFWEMIKINFRSLRIKKFNFGMLRIKKLRKKKVLRALVRFFFYKALHNISRVLKNFIPTKFNITSRLTLKISKNFYFFSKKVRNLRKFSISEEHWLNSLSLSY